MGGDGGDGGVRRAGEADHDTVLDIVVDAFSQDPLVCWVFEDPEIRPAGSRAFYEPQVRRHPPSGEMLLTAGGEAASVWFAPAPDSGLERVYEGFYEMLAGILGEATAQRKLAGLAAIGAAHPQTPHWYLAAVGTRTELQGKGFGPRVIRPVLDRCDREGRPAYLESSNVRNVPFYERLGFVVLTTVQLPDGGPVVTPMWREPGAG